MKTAQIMILLTALLGTCSCSAGNGKASGDSPESELELFNAVIPKSDLAALPAGTALISAEHEELCYRLAFSDGSRLTLGLHYSAYVTSDSEDWITINGKSAGHKVVDIPYYTLSSTGTWVKDGMDTGLSAIPDCPDSLTAAGAVLRYIRQSRNMAEAFFSDGSAMSFPQETSHEMFVSKTASEMDIWIGEAGDSLAILYPFKKRYRQYVESQYPSFLDNWGVTALRLCRRDGGSFGAGTEIFLNGEAEMALRVTDGRDESTGTYVGGALHGFEQISTDESGGRQLSVSVDGAQVPEDETLTLRRAERVVMTQESLVYQAYTTVNPFAKARRIWTFEDGTLTIDITLTMLHAMYCYDMMFGMLCVLRRWEGDATKPYLTRYAIKDNLPDTVHDLRDGWSGSIGSRDTGTRSITEYGEMGWSFALVVDETSHGGSMFVGTNGNAYNKIYFDMAHGLAAAAGETFHGRVHWDIRRTR